jgi:hypothetical protein
MKGFLVTGAVLLALAVPGIAHAATPTLVSVTATNGHIGAAWTPGGELQVIEAATSAAQGSSGSFFSENVKLFDIIPDGQTTYLDTHRSPPGTYYVHVSGYDDAPCYCRTWSNIVTVTILNEAPSISNFKPLLYGRYSHWISGSVRLCDPEGGENTMIFTVRRFDRGRVAAGMRISDTAYALDTCDDERFTVDLPSKMFKRGDQLRMDIQVRDPFGSLSAILSRFWTLR